MKNKSSWSRIFVLIVAVAFLIAAPGFAKGTQETAEESSASEGNGNPARADAMAANSGVPGFEFADYIVEKVRNGEKLVIKSVIQCAAIPFGQVIGSGVETAADDYGFKGELLGDAQGEDLEAQVNIMENVISSKVDGLIVSNLNADAVNPVIKRALELGIPVVTQNTDSPGSPTLAFYGQDLYQSGVMQAKMIVEHMGEKGTVFITTCNAAAEWSKLRESGVKDGLSGYPEIEVITVVDAGFDPTTCYANIENAFLANPDITCVASLDAVTTPAVGKVIQRMGLIGKVVHCGHDIDLDTLESIKAGATQTTISQNPYLQGYWPAEALYKYIMEGVVPESKDTGYLRIDETNVDEYLKRWEDGEPLA